MKIDKIIEGHLQDEEYWLKSHEERTIGHALFWSGLMSHYCQKIVRAKAEDISELILLLQECSNRYDTIIWSRIK